MCVQGNDAVIGGIMVALSEAMAEQAMAPGPSTVDLGEFTGHLVRPFKHIAEVPYA